MRDFSISVESHAMVLIPIREVAFRIGASLHFVKTAVAAGRMPAPLQLGERKKMWVLGEVEDWLQLVAAEREKSIKAVSKRK